MKLIVNLLIFIFLNASNCASDKGFKEIQFGTGGGFTGEVTSYRIKENGDVFKINSGEQDEQLIKSITAEELKMIREKIANVPPQALHLNHPYNMYSFIKIDTMNTVWGDPSYTIPKELQDLYNYLTVTATKQ